MSYKGWLIIAIISSLLIFGAVFYIRTSVPTIRDPNIPCYNIETEGIPQFLNKDFIELDKIEYIKRYRSAYGGDSADDFEEYRVMNHHYVAYKEYWSVERAIKIFSPIDGA